MTSWIELHVAGGNDTVGAASCGKCAYSETIPDYGFYCRRLPPRLVDADNWSIFPKVGEEDWCGEFLPLPQ